MGHGTENKELSEKLKDGKAENVLPARKHRQKTLPEKQFQIRPSLLTEMLEKKELQTVHNLFLAIMVQCIACAVLTDILTHGSLDLGYSNLRSAFGKIGTTLLFVLALHLTPILILYPVFYLWTCCLRSKIASKWTNRAFYTLMASIIFLAMYIPCHLHFGAVHLPWASSAAVAMEQLRICMKMYAFLRTNISRALKNQRKLMAKKDDPVDGGSNGSSSDEMSECKHSTPENHGILKGRKRRQSGAGGDNSGRRAVDQIDSGSDEFKSFDDDILCPKFSKFLYFLYAPTLIYRDNYPRTKSRNWGFILKEFVHSVGCIMFYNLMHQRFGYVMLEHIGPNRPVTGLELVNVLYYQFMLGMSCCVIGWLVLLHSTQNIFAELLMFGDRYFYKDWWNCRSMGEYHRTWNTPVQDFLYTYVYKEAWEHGLGKRFRSLPTLLVFFISNLFHEYAVCFVAGFFCPVMGIMFAGPGTFLTFIPNRRFPKLGNIFMLWSICLGHGFMHIVYVMEYFARSNGCPPAETPLQDFFIPRMLTCGLVSWS